VTAGEALTAETLAAMYRTASATCARCGEPATCLGAYAGAETEQYGCDECCGHGNEDGHCEEVGSVDTLRANSLALLAEVRRLTAALDGIRDTVELPATATTTEVVAAVEERAGMLAHAVQSWKARASGMEAAEREVARLRAIVEGRTAPPTDAEMREHMDGGGAWLVTIPARRQVRLHPETRYVDEARAASLLWWTEGARWVAVRDGRPCAWPAPREPAADVGRDAPGVG
jgi:hypothetical protein